MPPPPADRLTTRRIFLATFWIASAFGSWRLCAALGGPPSSVWRSNLEVVCALGSVALFGAGFGAVFGRSGRGAIIAVVVALGTLCVLHTLQIRDD